MTVGYRVSNLAREDIKGIGRYTQQTYGSAQRRRYLSGIEAKFALLADRPQLHPERSDFDPPVRIAQHEEHLIIYVLDGDSILIVRVLHKRMDVAAQLGDD
jgi:toxin ParE1/3/4